VLLTLHPLAELQARYRLTEYGMEAEMTAEEARQVGGEPGKLWWEVSNQASALYITGKTDEALAVAKQALQMKRAVNTLVNLAVILETQGRFDEAIVYEREAATQFPDDDRASALYGEALLRMGNFTEGWPLYRKNRASMDWAKAFLPEWNGQPLWNRRLLVVEGGGYGDNFYMLRWLRTLYDQGASITYVCQPTMASLVRHLGYTVVENWQGNVDIRTEDYDYFTPLLSLPAKLGVTLENYSWTGPYIRRWWPFRWLGVRSGRVGVCWKAGEAKSPRKQRSLHIEQRNRIMAAVPKGYEVVSLVRDESARRMACWLDTMRLLSGLGLVITVDTGIAHLAGAMGVATWTILPGAGAWQYPLGHDRHPLYPSMRVFRNPREGQDDAVDLVVSELAKYE
jgi:hypothetical protein